LRGILDNILEANDVLLLQGAGSIGAIGAEIVASQRVPAPNVNQEGRESQGLY
jgi:hypothetical protein